MATEVPGLVLTFLAGATITAAEQYRPVTLEADGNVDIAVTAGEGLDVVGFIQNHTLTVGQAATIMTSGVTKALVGTGDATAGQLVQVATDGVSDGVTTGDYSLGTFLDTGVAGDLVRVLINFSRVVVA